MLTVTGLWFDHERTPVGLDHTPVFGWQLEGNSRNIRQTQYRLQVALTRILPRCCTMKPVKPETPPRCTRRA